MVSYIKLVNKPQFYSAILMSIFVVLSFDILSQRTLLFSDKSFLTEVYFTEMASSIFSNPLSNYYFWENEQFRVLYWNSVLGPIYLSLKYYLDLLILSRSHGLIISVKISFKTFKCRINIEFELFNC